MNDRVRACGLLATANGVRDPRERRARQLSALGLYKECVDLFAPFERYRVGCAQTYVLLA